MCKIKTSFRKRISSSGEGCGFRKFPHPLTQIYCYSFILSIKCYRIIRQNIYEKGNKMEKETKEKLHDLIDSIDNEEILEYLYIFIKGKIKAEQ